MTIQQLITLLTPYAKSDFAIEVGFYDKAEGDRLRQPIKFLTLSVDAEDGQVFGVVLEGAD
jgi:hypothetical protein